MHLKLRRVTGSRPKLENMALTDELQELNIGRLALFLKVHDLEIWNVGMSDEFALLLFPSSPEAWELAGVKHVYGTTGEDKRQVTANAVSGAATLNELEFD